MYLSSSLIPMLSPPLRREHGNEATFLKLCLIGKMHADKFCMVVYTYHNGVESVGQDPVAVREMVNVV